MPDTTGLSEAKRALLEKVLRGNLPQAGLAASTLPQDTKAEMTGRHTRVTAIQTGGSKQPFFYLHGEWRDKAFYCYPLARALGADQPFYVLEPYTFEGLRVPPTLETIAAAHIELLCCIQPEGPYLLGGWCNGALVAYEMARQLHAQGQAVDLLVLMDSMVPGRLRLVRSVIDRLCGLLRLGQEKQLDWFLLVQHVYRYLRFAHYRQRNNSEHTETTEEGESRHRRSKGGLGLPRLDALITTAEALRQEYPNVFDWVTAGYTPSLYPGKITFFWAEEDPWRSKGWRKLAETKEVEVHIIPGNDITCRTEYLHALADILRDCVKKLQEPPSS